MNKNERARKKLRSDLEPGEEIVATIRLQASIVSAGSAPGADAARSAGRGTSHMHRYLDAFAPDVNLETDLRHDLGEPWFTITANRALFHKSKASSIRPAPGDLIDTCPVADLSLHWAAHSSQGVRNRLIALFWPDGRALLRYTPIGPTMRKKKNWDDEADALIAAFGDRAREVEVPEVR